MQQRHPIQPILLIVILFSSCIQKQKPLRREKSIAKSIVSAWGGRCTIERKKDNYANTVCDIVVTLRGSAAMAKKKMSADQLASNMAIRTYKLLTPEETFENAYITCIVADEGSERYTYSIVYDMQKVSAAVAGEGYFNYCANQFRSMETNTLFQRFDTTLVPPATLAASKTIIDSTAARMRRTFGPSWSDSMFCFNYTTIRTKDKTPMRILNCYGYILYEKMLVPFSVGILPDRNYDEPFLYSMMVSPM